MPGLSGCQRLSRSVFFVLALALTLVLLPFEPLTQAEARLTVPLANPTSSFNNSSLALNPTATRKPPTVAASANWVWQNPLPQGNTLKAINCPDANTCFAVGNLGSIIVTTDGGNTWLTQISGTNFDLYSVSCPSTTACYAAGGSYVSSVLATNPSNIILKTVNGGTTWKIVQNASSPNASPFLNVNCPSVLTCFATGNSGNILATTNGGNSWLTQYPENFLQLNSISCVNTTTCFAVGGGSTIFSTINGGSTWPKQNSGLSIFTNLEAISCVSATICFAVGGSGIVLATINGGTTWTVQVSNPSGSAPYLNNISCVNATTCIAVGDSGTILAKNSTTGSWVVQDAGSTHSLTGVSCPTATTCFAVGDNTTLLATSNGGSTWRNLTTGPTNDLKGVGCNSATVCFALVNPTYPAYITPTLLTTTDGGINWNAQPISNTYSYTNFNGISCVLASSNCVGVGDNGAVLTITSTTFVSKQISGTTVTLRGISCANVTTCYAVGDSGTIEVTTDGGTNWLKQTSGTARNLTSISCVNASVCFAVGDQNTVLATTNAGANWSSQSPSSAAAFTGISCTSATTCFAVSGTPTNNYGSSYGTIQATFNGGKTWATQLLTSPFSAISCLSTNTCYAIGDAGKILLTLDAGSTWETEISHAATSLRAISCFDSATGPSTNSTNCFAVGSDGTILAKTTTNLLVTNVGGSSNPGSLAYAFGNASSGQIVRLQPSADSTINVSASTIVPAGVILVGSSSCGAPATLKYTGTNPNTDGLILNGNNKVYNLTVANFSGKGVKFQGAGNVATCLKVRQ